VKEALNVADYAYVISDGAIVGKGTPDEIRSSPSAYLRQFVNALPDGPVRFHFPAPPLEEDVRLKP
jgi:phospholipid/cholesterol/gamma-HCH transport system ATP-binding protein